MTADASGSYVCVASNSAGSVESVATLSVHRRPELVLSPSGSVTVERGSPVRLTCTATADPEPSVAWQRMGDRAKM